MPAVVSRQRALVNRVRPGSPASRGGLKRGDLVTRIDGHVVAGARDFFQILETVTADQPLALEIWRNGSFMTKQVVAEEIPRRYIQEIAQQVSKSEDAVKSNLYRARKLLLAR